MRRVGKGVRRALVGLALAVLAGATAGAVYAAFFAATSTSGSSFAAKRIFPGTRSTSSWAVTDASAGGSGVDASNRVSFADGLTYQTGIWAASFGGTRYLDYDFAATQPAGLAVSSATLNFRFASSAAGGVACFYFEIRRISTGAVIATHGNTATPVGCVTGTAQATSPTPLPEVSTTDLANDLRARIYMRESGGRSNVVDMATVTGSTPYAAFTLHETTQVDRSTGTATTTPWSLAAAGDNGFLAAAASWDASYNVNKYLQLTVNGHVPTGAVVQNVTLEHVYRGTKSTQTCYLVRVFDGTMLIATYGSTGTPVSCSSSNTSWTSDVVPLPAVDTPAEANNLVVRVHPWAGSNGSTQHDRFTVAVSYYLD